MLESRRHVGSLDGVRGLAVLMVCCHHLCPWAAASAAGRLCATLWVGVDLFFVLSGFLITGLLYDTLGLTGHFRNFYARRCLRLVPVYVVVVAGVLLANLVLGGGLTVWSLPYFLYGSNVLRDLGLPIGVVPELNVSHLWSLAVEEQFYLLWPLGVAVARTRENVLGLCLAGSAFSVVARSVAAGHPHFGTPYFELPMRLDTLLLGGALAMMVRSPRRASLLTPARLHAVLFFGLAGLSASFAAARHGTMFSLPVVRYGYLCGALCFTALIGLALRQGCWASCALDVAPLRALGRCSYGLYLVHLVPFHWYAATLAWAADHAPSQAAGTGLRSAVFVAYFALCFGLATLSHNTLESFFLKQKRFFRHGAHLGGVALPVRTPAPGRLVQPLQ